MMVACESSATNFLIGSIKLTQSKPMRISRMPRQAICRPLDAVGR